MLKIPGVFLRRPFSIYDAVGSRLEFLYRVVGTGTGNFSKLEPGDRIDVLGPLGNGYPVLPAGKDLFPLLVAGGTGIASLHFLARKLRAPGILFFGARRREDLIGLDAFQRRGWKTVLATEDGSRGTRGYVTDAFAAYLDGRREKKSPERLYSCGPHAMLGKVAAQAARHAVPGYVSLEERMACGIGNCQGCAVRTTTGHRMACSDGPVFDIDEIEW